jgi:hypothetical protein
MLQCNTVLHSDSAAANFRQLNTPWMFFVAVLVDQNILIENLEQGIKDALRLLF